MNTKPFHKWINEQNFSYCECCDIRKRLIKEKLLISDGSTKIIYKAEYFTFDGSVIQNTGCIKEKSLQLNLF